MSQWIKIEDELPPIFEQVLILYRPSVKFLMYSEEVTVLRALFTRNGDSGEMENLRQIIAWQPLSEIPEEFR